VCHPACSTHGQTAPDAKASGRPLPKKKKENKKKKRKERILPFMRIQQEKSWILGVARLTYTRVTHHVKAAIGVTMLPE